MVDPTLATLAEHYAKHLIVETEIHARDNWAGDPTGDVYEFPDAANILQAHTALVGAAAAYDGQTITMRDVLSLIKDDGQEYVIAADKIRLDDIDTAMVCLATEFDALNNHAHEVMATFAGLVRLKKLLKEATGDK
ncbi:hypothetical protein [Sphaerisporangium sp. TRM90804]|uniref:hypothetical protein n=1 Tax=Sphaerisporangium sp. TRM90804 TaxID=3031113 RepID=UPI002446B460|nr:hypothetical protein [Sphaerisporangium sp. TRM90804]MDH2429336.1 hypothetical protein [Sphaerisporangium sp. TRM90804]